MTSADSTSNGRPRVAAVVYNPTKVDAADLKELVADEEHHNGWGPSLWFETTPDDAGQGVTGEAIKAGAAMIIAVGGDGTVRAVAEAVHGTHASLALLPSGTGNLLARNLKLTLDDAAHSIHTAFAGEDRPIDFGIIDIRREDKSVTRHGYVVMAGLGLDAKMLANTDDSLKAQIGWLAYVKALSAALRDKNRLRMRYRLDYKLERSIRAHTIIIGNCGALPANIVLLPDAAIDDGRFDILILRPEGFIGWVQIFAKVLWENGIVRRTRVGRQLNLKPVRSLRYKTASEVVVKLDAPQEIELDGDSFGVATALKTWVEPRSLIVRVPLDDHDLEDEQATTDATSAGVFPPTRRRAVVVIGVALAATIVVALGLRRRKKVSDYR